MTQFAPSARLAGAECPKAMQFGPCGGVRDDGSCELADRVCPFVDLPLTRWPQRPPDASTAVPSRNAWLLDAAAHRPVVLTDFTVRPYEKESVRRIVEILAPAADALLVGEHHNRPDFPPTQLAGLIQDAGGRPWLTLTCRDRNRIVLEQELAGLAAMEVPGVLCVTGDARGSGIRPDVTQVFDLDGMRLTSLAAQFGLTVAAA